MDLSRPRSLTPEEAIRFRSLLRKQGYSEEHTDRVIKGIQEGGRVQPDPKLGGEPGAEGA